MSPADRAMYFTDRTREQLFETFWRQAFGRASIARRRLSVREFVLEDGIFIQPLIIYIEFPRLMDIPHVYLRISPGKSMQL